MAGVRIVTDSGCDLSIATTDKENITVVPLSIRFGDDEYTDRTELTAARFYELMEASDQLPETAAPAPGLFDQEFRRLAAEGADAIVCINMSSDLSPTGQSARTAAAELSDIIDVHCVDSRSVSVGMGNLVVLAARDAAAGLDAATIVANTEDRSRRLHVVAVLDTLENLKKGGRIGGAQALLGNLLSIKPCIDVSTGIVEEAGKQRTRKKALKWLVAQLAESSNFSNLCVGHAQADDIDEVLAAVRTIGNEKGDTENIRLEIIGPVIGTHGGPRVVGVSWIEE